MPDELAEEREAIAAEFERISTVVETLGKQQTARQQALQQLPQQVEEAQKRVSEARAALDALLKSPMKAPQAAGEEGEAPLIDTETANQVRTYQARNLAWRAFLAALRAEQYSVRKVLLNLEQAAADRALPVLQKYAEALKTYRAALEKSASRSERELIVDAQQAANSAAAKTYWALRLRILDLRRAYYRQLDDIRERFPESERQELQRSIDRIEGRYTRLFDRLDRATGMERTDAYRSLGAFEEQFEARKESVSARLTETQRELDALLQRRDEAMDEVADQVVALKAAVQELESAELRQQFDQRNAELAAEYLPRLDAAMSDVINTGAEVTERLTEADAELAGFLENLQIYREKLYRAYVFARGESLVATLRAVPAEQASRPFWQEFARLGQRSWASARRLDDEQLGMILSAVLIGLGVGVFARGRMMRRAERLEGRVQAALHETSTSEVRVTERVSIQLYRLLGGLFPLFIPLVLLLALVMTGASMARTPRLVAEQLLQQALVLTIAWVTITTLFGSGKARFRIIQCSNIVANHYRFWLKSVWWLTLVCVPLATVMFFFDVSPALRKALFTSYSAVALVMLILFARNRQTIVRVFGRAFAQRRPIVFGAIVRAYPLILLLLLALLILLLVGYVGLVTYLVRNLVRTAAALVVAGLVSNLLREFATKHVHPAGEKETETAPARASEAAPAEREYDFDEVMQTFESRELGLLVSSLAWLGRWAIWLAALGWVAYAWGLTPIMARMVLTFQITSPAPETGREPVTVGLVLAAIIVFFGTFKVSRGIRTMLDAKVYPAYGHINRAAQATINSLLHYTLLAVGLYISLRLLHLNLGALAVLLGGLGLGLGLGLQPLVVNFVSGLILYAERHVKVGDIVMVGDELGEVLSISMRSTQIKSFDGIDMIIPNSEFVASKVTNWTLQDTKIRGKLNVGVAYGSDVAKVRDILLEVANKEPRCLAYPEPMVWFTDFAESSLNFTQASWFPTPGDRWFGMIDMRYEIDRRFKEAGIEIPFPQRTLTIHPKANLPITLTRAPRDRIGQPPEEPLPPDTKTTGDPPPV